ncbi:MAG: hypothetical protein QOK37_361 [Thermoanaerobaculia bacterium]|nr:hypothetical protein [Thermoanaerobaculia bacterium]
MMGIADCGRSAVNGRQVRTKRKRAAPRAIRLRSSFPLRVPQQLPLGLPPHLLPPPTICHSSGRASPRKPQRNSRRTLKTAPPRRSRAPAGSKPRPPRWFITANLPPGDAVPMPQLPNPPALKLQTGERLRRLRGDETADGSPWHSRSWLNHASRTTPRARRFRKPIARVTTTRLQSGMTRDRVARVSPVAERRRSASGVPSGVHGKSILPSTPANTRCRKGRLGPGLRDRSCMPVGVRRGACRGR